MNSSLAIAATTATLAHALGDACACCVTVGHVGDSTKPTIGLRLYRVAADPFQRQGRALVLHYRVSFHGDDAALEPDMLVGRCIDFLEANPILDHDAILRGMAQFNLTQDEGTCEITKLRLVFESLSVEEQRLMCESDGPICISVRATASLEITQRDSGMAIEP